MVFWFILTGSMMVGIFIMWNMEKRIPWLGGWAQSWLGAAIGVLFAACVAALGLGAEHPRTGRLIPSGELARGLIVASLVPALIGLCFVYLNWKRK